MTAKEAIEVLHGMIINDKNIPKAAMSQKNKNIALRTAIKALEAQDAMMLRVDIQETSAEDVVKMLKEMNNQPILVLKSNNSEIPNSFGKDTNVPSNDTISRKAAIDEMRRCRFVVDAIEKINGLPSAQPEYLHVIMEKIRKNYEKAMNVSYINDPMAVALSETWKEYVDEKEHKRG